MYSGHHTLLIPPGDLETNPALWLSVVSQYKGDNFLHIWSTRFRHCFIKVLVSLQLRVTLFLTLRPAQTSCSLDCVLLSLCVKKSESAKLQLLQGFWFIYFVSFPVRDTFCSYPVMDLCTKGLGQSIPVLKVWDRSWLRWILQSHFCYGVPKLSNLD